MIPSSFVALDFECANNSRLSACSIGLALFEHGSLTESRHWLLKPIDPGPFIHTKIHGICYDDVKNQASLKDIWYEVDGYLRNRFIVAHSAAFDMSVLKENLLYLGLPYENYYYNCTMNLAKQHFSSLKDFKLSTLCELLSLDYGNHDAEADAVSCGRLFQKMIDTQKYPDDLFNGSQLDRVAYVKNTKPFKFGINLMPANLDNLEIDDVDGTADLTFFDGKSVVVTGVFDSIHRQEVENYIIESGGCISKSVGPRLNMIVIGTEPGWSKIEKVKAFLAEGKQITVMDESEFNQVFDKIESLK